MPLPSDQRKDHPSTYFVQDRTNKDERTRVQIQDTMITKEMGGVLPEQADPTLSSGHRRRVRNWRLAH